MSSNLFSWICLLGSCVCFSQDVKTEHYDLHSEGGDAQDVGAMLEQLHKQLTKHFGKAPKEKLLRVEVYKTKDDWEAALKKNKEPVPDGAGGYYSPATKRAYLFMQPSEHFSRHLILHEATHQFHYLAATGNRNPSGYWYTEGLAEYFAMHTWDGKELRTGIVPAVTLEDYPSTALKNFDLMNKDLDSLVAGKTKVDRPESWALIHFLMNNYQTQFQALAQFIDKGEDAARAWKKVFGSKKLGDAFRSWIVKNAQPWKVVWTAWQQRCDWIEGKSDVVGISVLKKMPKSMKVEVCLKDGTMKAGIVFGFKSADDFHMLQLLDGGKARISRRTKGGWDILKSFDVPKPDSNDVIAVDCDGKTVTLKVNGSDAGSFEITGDVGLNVESCRAEFKVSVD